MKKLIFFNLFLTLFSASYAQVETNGPLKIVSGSGYYTQVGPLNSGFAHFVTDRPIYYFNKPITVNGAIGSYSYDLQLQAARSTKMTITTGGNVGIGTTSPSEKLHVNGGKLKVSNSGDEIIIDPHYYVGGEIPYRAYVLTSNSDLTFFNPNSGQYNSYIKINAGSFESQGTYVDSYSVMHTTGITMRNHRSDSRASVAINHSTIQFLTQD